MYCLRLKIEGDQFNNRMVLLLYKCNKIIYYEIYSVFDSCYTSYRLAARFPGLQCRTADTYTTGYSSYIIDIGFDQKGLTYPIFGPTLRLISLFMGCSNHLKDIMLSNNVAVNTMKSSI